MILSNCFSHASVSTINSCSIRLHHSQISGKNVHILSYSTAIIIFHSCLLVNGTIKCLHHWKKTQHYQAFVNNLNVTTSNKNTVECPIINIVIWTCNQLFNPVNHKFQDQRNYTAVITEILRQCKRTKYCWNLPFILKCLSHRKPCNNKKNVTKLISVRKSIHFLNIWCLVF